MLTVLPLFVLVVGAPTPTDVDAALIQGAVNAKARGASDEVERRLHGWATLRARDELPLGLEAEAASAILWAKDAGDLRLFAERLHDRVRVGATDPARVISRIDVWVQRQGDRIQLQRSDEGVPDRYEYRLDTDLVNDAEVIVEAVMTEQGKDLMVRRILLSPGSDVLVPRPPNVQGLTTNLRPLGRISSAGQVVDEAPVALWWIIGGTLAAALMGAAIVQEFRFE